MAKVVALAGGVGGAKLADGLAQVLQPGELTIVVNTGDDFEHFGLKICPDLDTVCYALAGIANPETGWGRQGETWRAIESAERLGAPTWFHLGDLDLGTHLERTRRYHAGQPLSQVTADFCRAWGIQAKVLPMTDDRVATVVHTQHEGDLAFQEYFVHRRCEPQVTGFDFIGIETARPAPGVLDALQNADLIVICPSNPWVSIGPILAVPGIQELVAARPVVAVSPIVGGKAIKGPAAKMYAELGFVPSALTVARHYGTLVKWLVIELIDANQVDEIHHSGIIPFATETIMVSREDRIRLARKILELAEEKLRRKPNQ